MLSCSGVDDPVAGPFTLAQVSSASIKVVGLSFMQTPRALIKGRMNR